VCGIWGCWWNRQFSRQQQQQLLLLLQTTRVREVLLMVTVAVAWLPVSNRARRQQLGGTRGKSRKLLATAAESPVAVDQGPGVLLLLMPGAWGMAAVITAVAARMTGH
jgi:hypothetical protein